MPVDPDGARPDRPVYVSADGQFAPAEFSFFNNSDSSAEFQPVFDCRRNCDGSDVIDVIFDPTTVAIAPYDCAVVSAFITNLTAPAGDTIVGQLYGATDESSLVFIDVYDPASGPPYTPSHTMLESLGLSDIVPPTRLLDIYDCTWASDGSSCEYPDPSQNICALDTLSVDLNADAMARLLSGESPAELIVQASPGWTPPPGRYHLLIAHYAGNVLDSPFTHHQYAFPCDSDGLASNNYTASWPWVKDFFIGTDLWFELLGGPGGWHAQVTDPRQDFATVSSDAFFMVAGRELILFIPEGELTPEATFRTTAFGHMGSYLQGLWSGDVQPAIGAGPLLPVATESFVVTPQSRQGPEPDTTPQPITILNFGDFPEQQIDVVVGDNGSLPVTDGIVLQRMSGVGIDGEFEIGSVVTIPTVPSVPVLEDFEDRAPGGLPAGWTTYGDSDWRVVSDSSGNHYVQPGDITWGESCTLEKTVYCGDGILSFDAVMPYGDGEMILMIDGKEIYSWSGTNWSEQTFRVPEGERTFRWTFSYPSLDVEYPEGEPVPDPDVNPPGLDNILIPAII